VLCGLLAGGLVTSVALRPQPLPGLSTQDVRAVVAEALAQAPAQPGAALDAATLNPLIEAYLMSDPRVLQRVSTALDTQLRSEARAQARLALVSLASELYEDTDDVVLGNPEGDVTLVEFFDYNCSFCRTALPDLATLLAEDSELKVILKDYPILSAQSVEAARIAKLVGREQVDYWAFHEALFTARGTVDARVALAEAAKLGLSPIHLELDMSTPSVTAALTQTMELARKLNITGTPTYVIGDEIVPGAVGVDYLRQRIASMRLCGSTECGPAAPAIGPPAPMDTPTAPAPAVPTPGNG